MPSPSITYNFSNGTAADATQVNQNFNDIINGLTDGTKDLSISALTCAGNVTLNGNTTIGNASSDDLTVTASLASTIPIKTTNSYNIGSITKGLQYIYLGSSAGSNTTRLTGHAVASDVVITFPAATDTLVGLATTDILLNKDLSSSTNTYRAATASVAGAVSTGSQTFAGAKTFNATITAVAGVQTTRGDDTSTGTVNSLTTASLSYIRFTASTTITLNGMNPGGNGQILILENQTGNNLTITNASGSAVSNGSIRTGTGANRTLPNTGAAMFIYNNASGWWVYVGI